MNIDIDTHLKSKDKDLPFFESVKNMQNILKEKGFDIEEVSWMNPLPNVWSVHIRERNCPMIYTNGKGITKDAALASALGEFFERASCGFFFADYFTGSDSNHTFTFHPEEKWFQNIEAEQLIHNIYSDLYNPDKLLNTEHLLEFNSGSLNNEICALPFQRLIDKKTVFFPINILDNLYVSNGMAAGNSFDEAKVQGLSEILERYIKNRIISEGISLPEIPLHHLEQFPHILTAIKKLENKGFTVLIKDASLGGKFPIVNVTLLSNEYGGIYTAFGAHPSFLTAIERTVTELLQGRNLCTSQGFTTPDFNIENVKSPINLEDHFIDSTGIFHWNFLSTEADFEFTPWNFDGSRAEEFEFLTSLIHEVLQKDIYIAEYDHLGVPACRIIIPGISEIYPFTDLIWNNKNNLSLIRESLLNLDNCNEEDLEYIYSVWAKGASNGDKTVARALGFASDTGIIVAEMSAMLALATGNFEDALIWLKWCGASEKVSTKHQNLYKCLETILKLESNIDENTDKFNKGLEGLFGIKILGNALAILEGTYHFPSYFPAPKESEDLKKIRQIHNICKKNMKN